MVERHINMAFNQNEYIGNYNKKTYKMYPFRVRKDDTKIIKKLSSVPNLNAYIHSLIEKDIDHNILTIEEIKERILPIFKKHNIDEAYLFGSYARGEATDESDIDIYCNSGDIKTFIDQGFLEEELENALGKEVDIIFMEATLDDLFLEELEKDKIRIC